MQHGLKELQVLKVRSPCAYMMSVICLGFKLMLCSDKRSSDSSTRSIG